MPGSAKLQVLAHEGSRATTTTGQDEKMATMPKQERARVTRENIVSAAASTFAGSSFARTSLADILEAADVTKGAFYFHFDAKEAVAGAVLELYADTLRETREIVGAETPSPLHALRRLCESALEDHPDALAEGLRLAGQVAALQPDIVTPYYGAWLETVGMLLHTAAAEGDLPGQRDPDELARVLVATLAGATLVTEALDPRERDGLVDAVWRQLLPDTLSSPRPR